MLGFLFLPANLPFAVAIVLMIAIAVLEGATSLLGHGLSQLIDGFLIEVDADADAGFGSSNSIDGEPFASENALSRLLGWLHVGKVPVLVLLVVLLTAFGLAGYLIQALVLRIVGVPLPATVASLPAALSSLAAVRTLGGAIGRLLPADESDAVSAETFIGRIAHIVRGVARRGSPAEAKLVDQHGATHYVLVEPDSEGDEFTAGSDLLIVARAGSVYRVIRNMSAAMRKDS